MSITVGEIECDLSDFVALIEAVEALCPGWLPCEADHEGAHLL